MVDGTWLMVDGRAFGAMNRTSNRTPLLRECKFATQNCRTTMEILC
jgi:hypothetical protein